MGVYVEGYSCQLVFVSVTNLISFAEHIGSSLAANLSLPRTFRQEFNDPFEVEVLKVEFLSFGKKFWELFSAGLVFACSGRVVFPLIHNRLVEFLLEIEVVFALGGICPAGSSPLVALHFGIFRG